MKTYRYGRMFNFIRTSTFLSSSFVFVLYDNHQSVLYCYFAGIHSCLCVAFHAFFWQSRLQYCTFLHTEHCFKSDSTLPQKSHGQDPLSRVPLNPTCGHVTYRWGTNVPCCPFKNDSTMSQPEVSP
mmetsp:Transcript_15465/g.37076  ORF Transcript_15465/g.37076 Transcript_15465/m.37076 type:complete len:126 (+) Transcript_15465:20-397(+)